MPISPNQLAQNILAQNKLFGMCKHATKEAPEGPLRQTAELIDQTIGHKNDHCITFNDVRTALKADKETFSNKLLEQHGLTRSEFQQAILTLDRNLQQQRALSEKPFCTSLFIESIIDPQTQAAAAAISETFGRSKNDLNLTELNKAKEALAAGTLPPGANTSAITEKHVKKIDWFMQTGQGNLVVHPNVTINGVEFSEAYPLPGNPDDESLIDDYNERFKETGYDLIYFKDNNEQLYVLLTIDKPVLVKPNMRVQMGKTGRYQDSGEVLAIRSTNNSLHKATIGFWADTVNATVETLRASFGRDFVSTYKNAAKLGRNQRANRRGVSRELLMLTGVGASLGVGTLFDPHTMHVALGAAGAVTVCNVADVVTKHLNLDRRPVYHAMGIAVNRDKRIY